MSILAGFDMLIELDRAALLDLLRTQPLMFDINPPFEITQVLDSTSAGGGQAHFVVTNSDVFLHAPSSVELRLTFEHFSIIGNTIVRRGLGGQDLVGRTGTIGIHIGLTLTGGSGSGSPTLDIDLRHATVRVRFVRAREDDAATLNIVEGAIASVVQTQVQRVPNLAVPMPFRIDPMSAPSLRPLVVREAQLRIFDPTDPARQSLALFLNLFATGTGDASSRRESGIPAGQNTMIALSPDTFHRLIFTPAVQQTLLVVRPELLPRNCGRAESVPYPDLPEWSITHIDDSLQSGLLRVSIDSRNVTTDDPVLGSTIYVQLRGHFTFTVDAFQNIVPHWTTDSATGSRGFAWGWYLLAVFIPGVWGTMALAAGGVAYGASIGSSSLAPRLEPISVPVAIPGSALQTVILDPDHFALTGTVQRRASSFTDFRLRVTSTTSIMDHTKFGSGVYHSDICPEGDFRWQSSRQTQRFTFRAEPVRGSYPITYEWSVSSVYPLVRADGSDALTLTADCIFTDPPPGEQVRRTDVVVPYQLSESGDSITLTALPEYGNYQLHVSCVAIDQEGRRASGYGHATVITHQITFQDGWDEAFAECVRQYQRAWRESIPMYVYTLGQPGPEPAPDPQVTTLDQEAIIEFMMQATQADPKGHPAIQHALITYGPVLGAGTSIPDSVARAGFSDLLKGKSGLAKQQEAIQDQTDSEAT